MLVASYKRRSTTSAGATQPEQQASRVVCLKSFILEINHAVNVCRYVQRVPNDSQRTQIITEMRTGIRLPQAENMRAWVATSHGASGTERKKREKLGQPHCSHAFFIYTGFKVRTAFVDTVV